MSRFHLRALLAFLKPCSVRFEAGKYIRVGGNDFFEQQTACHQVQGVVEYGEEVFELLPARGSHGQVPEGKPARLHLGG